MVSAKDWIVPSQKPHRHHVKKVSPEVIMVRERVRLIALLIVRPRQPLSADF